MSMDKRRKKTEIVADGSSDDKKRSRKIWGKTKKIVLESCNIPEVYHNDAVVKKDSEGLYHIFYGGLSNHDRRYHGHAVVRTDGTLVYQRLPFDKHSWGCRFENGQPKRGHKSKRHSYY